MNQRDRDEHDNEDQVQRPRGQSGWQENYGGQEYGRPQQGDENRGWQSASEGSRGYGQGARAYGQDNEHQRYGSGSEAPRGGSDQRQGRAQELGTRDSQWRQGNTDRPSGQARGGQQSEPYAQRGGGQARWQGNDDYESQWRGAQSYGNQSGAQSYGNQSARGYGDRDEGQQSGQWATQASDQLPDGRYAGQAGARQAGQGQGREWRSEYNNQPEMRQGSSYGGAQSGSAGAWASDQGAGSAGGERNQGGQWNPRQQRSAGGPETSQGSHRGRGPKGYTRSDERIAEDLCEKLADDDLVDASEISVEVRQGVAVLTGTVEQRWMKHHVEDIAERCSGVKDVDNQVRVQRGGPANQGRERSDAQQVGGGAGTTAGAGQPQSGQDTLGSGQSAGGASATSASNNATAAGNGREGSRRPGGQGAQESSTGKQDS